MTYIWTACSSVYALAIDVIYSTSYILYINTITYALHLSNFLNEFNLESFFNFYSSKMKYIVFVYLLHLAFFLLLHSFSVAELQIEF